MNGLRKPTTVPLPTGRGPSTLIVGSQAGEEPYKPSPDPYEIWDRNDPSLGRNRLTHAEAAAVAAAQRGKEGEPLAD